MFKSIAVFLILFLAVSARGDRWFAATALDTEGFESGYSETVQAVGWFTGGITFGWTPNTEPDIYRYQFHVKDAPAAVFMPIEVEIKHLDHCKINLIENECMKTFAIEDPQDIRIERRFP